MDREGEVFPELLAGGEGADEAVVGERRIPGTRRRGRPEGDDVVETVAVAHYDDVLAERRGVGQAHRRFGGKISRESGIVI